MAELIELWSMWVKGPLRTVSENQRTDWSWCLDNSDALVCYSWSLCVLHYVAAMLSIKPETPLLNLTFSNFLASTSSAYPHSCHALEECASTLCRNQGVHKLSIEQSCEEYPP